VTGFRITKAEERVMRHIGTAIGTLLVVAAVAGTAQAGDPGKGQELHYENCLSCHGTEAYTRADRKIASLDSLITQVNRCNVSLGTGWFDDEVESVANYLNENYYKF
jgi:mono/diheme cytochrome c family protein